MVLSQWPASERPRERFIAEGANKLTDAELIALVLHTGVRGRSTVDLARSLLTEYGGLANRLRAAMYSRIRPPRAIISARASETAPAKCLAAYFSIISTKLLN